MWQQGPDELQRMGFCGTNKAITVIKLPNEGLTVIKVPNEGLTTATETMSR
jgi:hypothetical protein